MIPAQNAGIEPITGDRKYGRKHTHAQKDEEEPQQKHGSQEHQELQQWAQRPVQPQPVDLQSMDDD
jgi:hypothetical protein